MRPLICESHHRWLVKSAFWTWLLYQNLFFVVFFLLHSVNQYAIDSRNSIVQFCECDFVFIEFRYIFSWLFTRRWYQLSPQCSSNMAQCRVCDIRDCYFRTSFTLMIISYVGGHTYTYICIKLYSFAVAIISFCVCKFIFRIILHYSLFRLCEEGILCDIYYRMRCLYKRL